MRAGLALRQKWADEARRAQRASDPICVAQDAAERAAMNARNRTLRRYGLLMREAVRRGELTHEQWVAKFCAAEDRTAERLSRQQARIFGW